MCRLGLYMAGVPVRLESRGAGLNPDSSHIHMVDRPLSLLSLWRNCECKRVTIIADLALTYITSKLESRSLNRDIGV